MKLAFIELKNFRGMEDIRVPLAISAQWTSYSFIDTQLPR